MSSQGLKSENGTTKNKQANNVLNLHFKKIKIMSGKEK